MKSAKAAKAPKPIAESRVKHETPWTCWRIVGGCGRVFGLNFPGGPCPDCGAFAVTRVVLIKPEGAR